MKSKQLKNARRIFFFLFKSFGGFAVFLLVVLLGEFISGSFIYRHEFHLEDIHFQIALLGGILQGSLHFLKSREKSI